MADALAIGPYTFIDMGNGNRAPFYIIPFDKDGRCEAPATREHLLADLAKNGYTDLFLVSHGWNNSFGDALQSYSNFLDGYIALRREDRLVYGRTFRPLLVGVYWPSAILVLPDELAPEIAAETIPAAAVDQERREVAEVAAAVKPADIRRFYELAQQQKGLTGEQALELARILLPVYKLRQHDELPSRKDDVTPDEIKKSWLRLTPTTVEDDSGEGGLIEAGGAAGATTEEPAAAALADFFGLGMVRQIIRAATVLMMKDRAGKVGARGIADLLADLLAADTNPRMHLVGHSYGCKVLLSAVVAHSLPRPVNSILLIQPAISYLAFSANARYGKAGGYRKVIARIEQPILTTFSARDVALHDAFHLIVRREPDVGEMQIAGDTAPSQYAALGGYGPGGCTGDCATTSIKALGEIYSLRKMPPHVIGIDATAVIGGHGDYFKKQVYWALFNQVNS